jgi:O-antigen ligase
MAAGPVARVERWFLRAGLFILPLAYWAETYDSYVLPKLLVARTLVIGLLILFVIRVVARGSLEIKRTPLDLPWAAFLASALVSTILATSTNVAIFGTYTRYDGLLTIVTYAALFWLSVQSLSGPDDARGVLRTLLASGYVVAAIAVIQAVTGYLGQEQVVPAYGTLGNPNVLGAFLLLLLPLAYGELVAARSWSARILVLNAGVMLSTALLLSFSRSAWLGAVIAFIALLVGERRARVRLAIAGAGLLVILVVAVPASILVGGPGLERELEARARSAADMSTWQSSRLHIWRDSLSLIASRPVFGYGPDNVGLVFPRFQTGDWAAVPGGTSQSIDKAHADTLQVAATQGLVGLAAYAFLMVAFIRTFWKGRRNRMALPIFAGWLGYEVTVQLNFSAPAAAMPFWIFAAAAMHSWSSDLSVVSFPIRQRLAIGAGGVTIAAAILVGAWWVALPYLADARLLKAVEADFSGNPDRGVAAAMQARELWPFESVYAVEVGNLAYERGDWEAARVAYLDAAQLGSYNPAVYRRLALSDQHIGGRTDEAHAAAHKAVELDRFDPANRALLAQYEQAKSVTISPAATFHGREVLHAAA